MSRLEHSFLLLVIGIRYNVLYKVPYLKQQLYFFDPCMFIAIVWKRISVMVCKKSAYPNCSGRLITVPEDLKLLRNTFVLRSSYESVPEQLVSVPEQLVSLPEQL